MTTLNQTEFAKQNKWSKGYVSQLKAAGRLVMTDDGKLVEVEKSMQLIADTADANRDDVAARHAADRASKAPSDKQPKAAVKTDAVQLGYQASRARAEHFKALDAEIEYNKKVGELVSKKDMEMAVADLVMVFRQSMENLPHLMSPLLVNKDIDYIRATLRDGVENSLKELGANCKKMIDERTVA